MSRFRNGCVVFVGNIPGDMSEDELEDAMRKFGRIHRIELKTPPRPPAFAFVEFEESRAAEEAVRKGDVEFRGTTLRIELARGGGPPSMASGGRGAGRSSTRSPYRVLVKGLPPSASWQDVKVVDPTFAKVYTDKERIYGVVEFDSYDDLKYAIRKLDDTEFKNRYDRSFIRVVNDSDKTASSSDSESRSRSYSRSRSRSRSRGKRRRRSASRSRSRSESRSRSRSRGGRHSKSYSEESERKSDSRSRGGSPKEDKRGSSKERSPSPAKDGVNGRESGSHRSSEAERRDRSRSA